MRGADINFVNINNGFTPLHRAIVNNLDVRVIKFLIKQGSYLHSKDLNGLDCCDKAAKNPKYSGLKFFEEYACKANPKLRQTYLERV